MMGWAIYSLEAVTWRPQTDLRHEKGGRKIKDFSAMLAEK
jgi:hypothetical protein